MASIGGSAPAKEVAAQAAPSPAEVDQMKQAAVKEALASVFAALQKGCSAKQQHSGKEWLAMARKALKELASAQPPAVVAVPAPAESAGPGPADD